MRKLYEIVEAVRSGKPAEYDELAYAVVAFDVLLHQIDLPNDPVRLAEYFKAAELPPPDYFGWANHPQNPEAIEWYTAMASVQGPGNGDAST